MKKEYLYIKCFNIKGKVVGTLAISNFEELFMWSKVYPKWEFLSEEMNR